MLPSNFESSSSHTKALAARSQVTRRGSDILNTWSPLVFSCQFEERDRIRLCFWPNWRRCHCPWEAYALLCPALMWCGVVWWQQQQSMTGTWRQFTCAPTLEYNNEQYMRAAIDATPPLVKTILYYYHLPFLFLLLFYSFLFYLLNE